MNCRLRLLNIVLYAAFAWLVPAVIAFALSFSVAGWICIAVGAVQFIITVEVMQYLEEYLEE